jgi:hypothetical protein
MDDNTSTFSKTDASGAKQIFEDGKSSHFMGLSLRGMIALIVVVNACAMGLFQIKEPDSLAYLTALVVGHYFGQVNKNSTNGTSTTVTTPTPKV